MWGKGGVEGRIELKKIREYDIIVLSCVTGFELHRFCGRSDV